MKLHNCISTSLSIVVCTYRGGVEVAKYIYIHITIQLYINIYRSTNIYTFV